ncbi:hypothetical protein QBC47DRAFT_383316 [Echria macrotheca]|uniref:Uncharacterized protein n=1 Tax=Echria macrotheca TaxID=438768 RepID=A0AAJ0F9E7_9PEZI|nr:hypothetical protein QBC47DRAFT_383316 [Echria macrotheca]
MWPLRLPSASPRPSRRPWRNTPSPSGRPCDSSPRPLRATSNGRMVSLLVMLMLIPISPSTSYRPARPPAWTLTSPCRRLIPVSSPRATTPSARSGGRRGALGGIGGLRRGGRMLGGLSGRWGLMRGMRRIRTGMRMIVVVVRMGWIWMSMVLGEGRCLMRKKGTKGKKRRGVGMGIGVRRGRGVAAGVGTVEVGLTVTVTVRQSSRSRSAGLGVVDCAGGMGGMGGMDGIDSDCLVVGIEPGLKMQTRAVLGAGSEGGIGNADTDRGSRTYFQFFSDGYESLLPSVSVCISCVWLVSE